ncbi:MAG: metalloregulator ArsR/SmtB family transcription factor [Bacteroidia bacterium]|nr:metalloregulator ArsR/SmtB family transcription factor [Bacteroidia bacterium]
MKQKEETEATGTLESLTLLMQALSDENRLRIINLLLARDELCVCDIQSVLAMPQTRVSRHLTILKNAGLVTARRDARWMYYTLLRDTPLGRELCAMCERTFPGIPALAADLTSLNAACDLVCCTFPVKHEEAT